MTKNINFVTEKGCFSGSLTVKGLIQCFRYGSRDGPFKTAVLVPRPLVSDDANCIYIYPFISKSESLSKYCYKGNAKH